MKTISARAFEQGPCYLGRIPDGEDVLERLVSFCLDNGISLASVAVSGGLSRPILGTFDASQQVYVTQDHPGSWEITACTGFVTTAGDQPEITVNAMVTEPQGRIVGGRMFSPCPAQDTEFCLTPLAGAPLKRTTGPEAGRAAWEL